MTNKTDMLARLRIELNDGGSTKTWTDTYLNDLLVEANDWYSLNFPMKVVGYKDVAANQRTFSFPTGVLDVSQIEMPPGHIVPYSIDTPQGNPTNTASHQTQTWGRWGSTIYIRNPASGAEVGTNFMVFRGTGAWDRPDPIIAWTGPDADVRLLILWSAWQAASQNDLNNALQGRATVYGKAGEHFKLQLDSEVALRRRRLSSRTVTNR